PPPPLFPYTTLFRSPARATKLADVARAAAGGCAMPDPTSARTSATLRFRIRQRLPRGEHAGIAPWVNARNGMRGTNVAYPVSRGTRMLSLPCDASPSARRAVPCHRRVRATAREHLDGNSALVRALIATGSVLASLAATPLSAQK